MNDGVAFLCLFINFSLLSRESRMAKQDPAWCQMRLGGGLRNLQSGTWGETNWTKVSGNGMK
jgi:hypothetical protein